MGGAPLPAGATISERCDEAVLAGRKVSGNRTSCSWNPQLLLWRDVVGGKPAGQTEQAKLPPPAFPSPTGSPCQQCELTESQEVWSVSTPSTAGGRGKSTAASTCPSHPLPALDVWQPSTARHTHRYIPARWRSRLCSLG